jgi:hypothetical protein
MFLDQHISPLIASQFPEIYRDECSTFIAFAKAYYQWLESTGQNLNQTRNLLNYRDIDTTPDTFLNYFRDKYLDGVPQDVLGDKRLLIKHIKEVFASKGTSSGLKVLFQLLYNQPVDIYFPGDDVFRPSEGVWKRPIYLEVSHSSYNILLVGATVTGRESGATAIVEDFQQYYLNGKQINCLYLSNLRGNFKTGEVVLNSVISAVNSPTIIGSFSGATIGTSSFNFNIGDILDVIDLGTPGNNNQALNHDPGTGGKCVVTKVSSRAGAVSFAIQDGGSGFAQQSQYTNITVTAANGSVGSGATFQIGSLSNTSVVSIIIDKIANTATSVLSGTYTGFVNLSTANSSTRLIDAFTINNLTIGTIASLTAINPGAGYNGLVTVDINTPLITQFNWADPSHTLGVEGHNANVSTSTGFGNGAVDSVMVIDSGFGYVNGSIVNLIPETGDLTRAVSGTINLSTQGQATGFWKDHRSFCSSDKYIQDSHYYQEFSYEVQSSVAFKRYTQLLQNLWHPSGTESFGKTVLTPKVDAGTSFANLQLTYV